MKHYVLAFIFLSLVFTGFGQTVDEATKLLGELTPIRENFDVQHYDLSVAIDIENQSITGQNVITYKAVEDINEIQVDLQEPLQVESITRDGNPLTFEKKFNSYFVSLGREIQEGSTDSITVKYSGKPKAAVSPPWDGGFVWETDSLGQPWVGVACEGEGASVWWPNKDHLSDEPDLGVKTSFRVPSNLKAIGNGKMINTEEHDDGTTTYTWKTVHPIDNYNVTVNIGDYVNYTDFYQRPIPPQQPGLGQQQRVKPPSLDVDYYILSYHVDQAKQHFSFVEDVIGTFEFVFGPYPFYEDGFGIVETPYLGMEHQGAIAYGNNFEQGYRGQLVKPYIEFDYLFVHETAHEWWGNNISVKDRADIWIQEGFASYADAIYVVSSYGFKAYLEYMDYYRSQVRNQEPVVGEYDINHDIPGDAYYKTALMLNTLSQLIESNQDWIGIMQKAQQQFRAPYTVTGQEFRDFLTEESGIELTAFFQQYLDTTMIPKLQMKLVKDDGDEFLIYRWTNVVDGFDMPVQLEYAQYKQKWIYPEQDWKKVELPKETNKQFLTVDERSFYIDLQFER